MVEKWARVVVVGDHRFVGFAGLFLLAYCMRRIDDVVPGICLMEVVLVLIIVFSVTNLTEVRMQKTSSVNSETNTVLVLVNSHSLMFVVGCMKDQGMVQRRSTKHAWA